jgi:hypothetical protein
MKQRKRLRLSLKGSILAKPENIGRQQDRGKILDCLLSETRLIYP